MTITLYKIKSDERDLYKPADISHKIADLTAHLKGDVDILNPVLEISYDDTYIDANYVYIPAWDRYYFVTNRVTGMQRLFIECGVDVLMSHRADIRDLHAVVARQQYREKCDMYLNDKAFKAQVRKVLSTRYFPKSFSKTQSLILTTGGKS